MAYIVPRAFIVLIGWAITCGLIINVWSHVDAKIFCLAGASWALAGILCFGYTHRLRREAKDPHGWS
jgi:hypothetical protein